jgi:hypothetical protein
MSIEDLQMNIAERSDPSLHLSAQMSLCSLKGVRPPRVCRIVRLISVGGSEDESRRRIRAQNDLQITSVILPADRLKR